MKVRMALRTRKIISLALALALLAIAPAPALAQDEPDTTDEPDAPSEDDPDAEETEEERKAVKLMLKLFKRLPLVFLALIPTLLFPQTHYNLNRLDAKWSRAIYNEWADALAHPLEPGAARPPALSGEPPSQTDPPPGCPFHPRCHRAPVDDRQRARKPQAHRTDVSVRLGAVHLGVTTAEHLGAGVHLGVHLQADHSFQQIVFDQARFRRGALHRPVLRQPAGQRRYPAPVRYSTPIT